MNRVFEQRSFSDPGVALEHENSASSGDRFCKQPVEGLAFVAPAAQRHVGPIPTCWGLERVTPELTRVIRRHENRAKISVSSTTGWCRSRVG